MNLNQSRLTEVVEQAKASTAGHKFATRWQNAIAKAESILKTSNLWSFTTSGILLLCSPDSDKIYETDGRTCEVVKEKRVKCAAFGQGYPCKHRAMHRLLVRYAEGEQLETIEAREEYHAERKHIQAA